MAIFDVPLSELRRRGTIKWRRWEPDVLPLFVAEMDVHLAPPIRAALERALADGDTGYPELPAYQEAFADYAEWQWGWRIDVPDQKLATDVVTGMREAVLAFAEPGDAVVINSPIYPPFRHVVTTTGRRLVDVPLVDDRLDLAGLEAAFVEQRPKVFLLCSPHNPNGTIHTVDELAAVARLAERFGVVVVSDEIHAPLAGAEHTPYLAVPGAGNALIVTSASKSWNLAALKAALIIGDRSLLKRLNPMTPDGASYFGVLAHSAALNDARGWVGEAAAEIAANKRFFAEELAIRVPELSYTQSEGTYLAWLDCSPLGLESPGKHFHDEGRVRFNLGREFSPQTDQFVRVNLATSREIIAEAVERMSSSLLGVRAEAAAVRARRAEPTEDEWAPADAPTSSAAPMQGGYAEVPGTEATLGVESWHRTAPMPVAPAAAAPALPEAIPMPVTRDVGPPTAPMPAVVDAGPPTAPMPAISNAGPPTAPMPLPPLAGVHTNSGEFVNVRSAVVVGRDPRNAAGYEDADVLRVPSPHLDISRNHLVVEARGAEIVVRDLHSVNGTLVLPPGETPFTLLDGASAHVELGTILDVGEGVSLRIEPPRL